MSHLIRSPSYVSDACNNVEEEPNMDSTESESSGVEAGVTEDESSDSEHYISDRHNSVDEHEAYNRYVGRAIAREKSNAKLIDQEKESKTQKALLRLEETVKAGKLVPLGALSGGTWGLYCSEFYSHYYVMEHLNKTMRFGKLYNRFGSYPEMICGTNEICGELHIYPYGHLQIYPFVPPSHASLEPVVLKAVGSVDVFLNVIFLGDSYLKLRVELAILIEEKTESYQTGESPVMEFSGIWVSDEERSTLVEERLRQAQPPSPRNSFASQLCGWDSD